MKWIKPNLLAFVYLILCLASLTIFIVDQPNKFSSIFIVILTIPWSFAITEILFRLEIAIEGLFSNACMFLVYALINLLIIKFFSK